MAPKKRKAPPALPKSKRLAPNKRPPKLRPMGKLVYPPNSGGDLFRLLPFEGYLRVLSFLCVQQLPAASRVCRGWQYAVGCREKIDMSITCKSMAPLEKFLKSLLRKDHVSAIRVDTSESTITEDDLCEERYSRQIPTLFRIKRLTWKCKDFAEDDAEFLEFMFPDLETLKLDIQTGDGAQDLKIKLPNLYLLKSVFLGLAWSIVAKGHRSRRINAAWTGTNLGDIDYYQSLRLEGIIFTGFVTPDSSMNFGSFLSQAHRLTSLVLDLDRRWWDEYGDRFESGILNWIRGKRKIIRFRMPQLSRHLLADIQRLLRERRKTYSWTSDPSDDEYSSDEFPDDFPFG